jgi:outer membrane protein OmpA-like peptidoglycan-associated protein
MKPMAMGKAMRRFHAIATLCVLALLLGACASTPTTSAMLDQARGQYDAAQNDRQVTRYAPLELKQAADALDQANVAAARGESVEQVDKLAYLARQKSATALEVGRQKAAEAQVAQAGRERDAIMLEQRTLEAQRAMAQSADAQRRTEQAEDAARQSQARAAQLAAELADLAAKKTDRGTVITIGDVLFASGQARLTAEGMGRVRKLADVLQQNPQRTVLVEGYTDNVGSHAYNEELSARRADAVRSALMEMGIARERVAVRAYGESNPVASNTTPAKRQLNRRVEIILSDESGKIAAR